MSKANFPVNPVLTAIAIAYRNRRMIADDVLPRTDVGKQEFKYLQHDLGEGFTVDLGTRHDEAAADVLFALDFLLVSHFDEFTEKFGEERVKNEGTIFFYVMSRCFMLRRWRRPAALVSRGQYPS